MKEGTDRICNISNSLRTFSRADTERKVLFNLHEGINNTLLVLKHRLKANLTFHFSPFRRETLNFPP
ncbi:hypothetical protein [Nostoc sp. NOS(2021)]|uniref:hypothetical protein n=1 Tax=Nostoc sp. NOS(2021) TaxID=2815407 RepID=UPI0025E1D8C3|nr:hypothetical protein [Nostoc sp. NOS(2021)]